MKVAVFSDVQANLPAMEVTVKHILDWNPELVVSSLVSMDDTVGNYVRFVEQEFYEDENPDAVWHDWTLEIRIANILTSGHWQVPVAASPMEWAWHAGEAEQAFERACLLVGRRVRKGLVVDEPAPSEQVPPQSIRH